VPVLISLNSSFRSCNLNREEVGLYLKTVLHGEVWLLEPGLLRFVCPSFGLEPSSTFSEVCFHFDCLNEFDDRHRQYKIFSIQIIDHDHFCNAFCRIGPECVLTFLLVVYATGGVLRTSLAPALSLSYRITNLHCVSNRIDNADLHCSS